MWERKKEGRQRFGKIGDCWNNSFRGIVIQNLHGELEMDQDM
jgi:hypothetical protein